MENGIPSKRYGLLKTGDYIGVESSCYQENCNYVSNGLFSSGILVIVNPDQPHDASRKINCSYIFPLADDKEMVDIAIRTDMKVK